MALKTAPGLLKAIEGFKGETAGSKEHEDINAHLARVSDEIQRGHSTPQDSPGRKEAAQAAQRAFQRNFPEDTRKVGDDNRGSVPPGSAREGERPAQPISERAGGGSDKISEGPIKSANNLHSAKPSSGFSGGDAEIRRMAAARELSRPDDKMHHTEGKPGGNRESVGKAPKAPPAKRIGGEDSPSITNTQKPGEVASAGNSSDDLMEDQPETVGKSADAWSRANAKAKAKLALKAGAEAAGLK
jgi:hypothetical protein